MTISYNWLLNYLPEPVPLAELCNILTSIGLEVEGTELAEVVPGSLKGLVIGEVLTCERHPNADKLSVTTVTVGGPEVLNIVCGAPNVAAGQKIVVATVGTTVHPLSGEPFQIKKAKIRGSESAGMICAEDEIGLGSSHAGIIILPAEAKVGTPAAEYYQIPASDHAIHIGLTPNRSDANSHIGVARDVCAYLAHHGHKKPEVVLPPTATQVPVSVPSPVRIRIEEPGACKRYAGISLKNVKVGPSPEWMKQRLQTIGVRSINNIVDITNFVLHEYGQPLHAFDADKLAGNEVIVKFLPEGTPFTTLDGTERKMGANDLMICDANGALAMGGVFGGLHSGITDTTSNVFIESAYFTPLVIRKTSMRHNLRTDAAQHFEKGVDMGNVIPAMLRAASLMVEIAGATLSSSVTDVFPEPLSVTEVPVTYEFIRRLSGKAYSAASIDGILTALGFGLRNKTELGFTATVPSCKSDISQAADIVEEVLRIDGLDNIEIPEKLSISLLRPRQNDIALREKLSTLLCGMGLQEIVTNSIVNSRYYPGNETLVRMINSLSSELDVMRPSMLECGLEVIAYNCNRKNTDLALYEFGNVYGTTEGKYAQEAFLAIWLTGQMVPAGWEKKTQPASVYYLKGILKNLADASGIVNAGFSANEEEVSLKWKNKPLAIIRTVTDTRTAEFGIKQKVVFAEIRWEYWQKAAAAARVSFREIPRFPSVERDLAIVIDKNVPYEHIATTTEKLKLEALRGFDVFDIFESEKLGAGKKSLALNFVFRLNDRTLTDAETEQLMSQLSEAYKSEFNAQIRD